MRHANPNMSPSVLMGIADGEQAAADPNLAPDIIEVAYRQHEEQSAALVAPGDRPFVVGAFLKAKELAFTQGFIAAYRTATEFCSHPGTVSRSAGIFCSRCGAPTNMDRTPR